MSNNYSAATVTPNLPGASLTPERIRKLVNAGYSLDGGSGLEGSEIYLYAEDGVTDQYYDEETGEDADVDSDAVLQEIAAEAGIEILVECSWWSDKLRQGEFGGAVTRITAEGIQCLSTHSMALMMRVDPRLGRRNDD